MKNALLFRNRLSHSRQTDPLSVASKQKRYSHTAESGAVTVKLALLVVVDTAVSP
jgi:hypothetical protein